jgi:hypothetical protein
MASNNDGGIRVFDMEKFLLCKTFRFDWPVNVNFSILLSPTSALTHAIIHRNRINFIMRELLQTVDFFRTFYDLATISGCL